MGPDSLIPLIFIRRGFIMSTNCPDCQAANANTNSTEHVPNFAVTGFSGNSRAVPQLAEGVHALFLSVCVGANYNSATNQICFSIPIYGNYCVTSPISIPIGGEIKVCAQTCGSFIPKGLKATVYLNDSVIFTTVLFGSC